MRRSQEEAFSGSYALRMRKRQEDNMHVSEYLALALALDGGLLISHNTNDTNAYK
jgi:hypothetical protein